MDDCVGREAAAFSADEGDDAIGAAGIAAVLNFERGAGVVPFPAEDGAERNSVRSKMLPVRMLPSMGRSMLRPYKGVERDGGIKCNAAAGKKSLRSSQGQSGDESELERSGICGLWELPTTQETPGRAASSSGARWA